MGASPEVVCHRAAASRASCSAATSTVLLLFLINAVFRGAGDAAIAMRVLWFGNLLNIVLGPLLHLRRRPVPRARRRPARRWRPTSAAARRVVYQLVTLARGARPRQRATRQHLAARPGADAQRACGCRGSGTLQILIGTASYIGLIRILSTFGSVALAGYTIGIRVIIFALLPAFGISNAAATMVGQNLGARTPGSRRARGVDGGASTTWSSSARSA